MFELSLPLQSNSWDRRWAKHDGEIRGLALLNAGDGGEITWDTGGLHSNEKASTGGGYKGSNSLLKSALQKNVRLCRPDSAVRCPFYHTHT